jgi:hypothetical protein
LEWAVWHVADAADPQHAVPSQQNVPHAIPAEQLHCPPEHVSPAAQAWPQAPQFSALVVTSTQALPQNACPAGQQRLEVQLEPAGQAFPHAPHDEASEVRSAHFAPPQSIVPDGQTQAPEAQTEPASVHAWPHVPQFAGSESPFAQ